MNGPVPPREHDLFELCVGLCRPERDAVLIQVEADDPELAARVRRRLEAVTAAKDGACERDQSNPG